ncbi:hypothetical protein BEN47_12320 [Hymenobacter lapidarius]|uniref:Carboxylic ester hydrolase n=2 Tax=Hymenobacter lapidarius TaxID=1908237 RepID=A0A1G1T7A7_9BACT|nr:hypothetical protein BEN47_12320 [Hymenobacter lapidarius]
MLVPLPKALRQLAPAALLVLVVQLAAEGPRWQLVPAYGLTGGGFLVWLRRISRPSRPPHTPAWAIGLSVLGLAAIGLLPLAFPVFHFPPPGGPYGIGTVTYHWVDEQRQELFSPDPRARRELLVQVWYPAAPSPSAPRTPYLPDAAVVMPALARLHHLPAFVFAHFRYVRTNAVAAAPVAAGAARFPVLLFLEGVTGFRQMNTFQVEELVSHGYVVAALDQPGTAAAVVFPNGHRAAGLPVAQLRALIRPSHVRSVPRARLFGRALADTSLVPYLAQDVRFVLRRLAGLHQADPHGLLTGRLDVQRAGVFGISLGGIVAAEACRVEPRLRACLVLDAPVPTAVVRAGLRQPTLWLTRDAATMRLERRRAGGWSEEDIQSQQTSVRAAYRHLKGAGYLVRLPGMFHSNFTDLPRWFPFGSWLGLTGPLNADRGHAIVNAYSVAFFDQHLKTHPAARLDSLAAAYPEVLFESRRP